MLRDRAGAERVVPAALGPSGAVAGTSRRSALLVGLAAVPLVLLGCGVRIAQWSEHRSLWMDEQFVALGLRRPFGALAGALPYDQAAPLGWLWAEHGLLRLFGPGESVLRLLPLLAGCAGVAAAALVARRLLTPPAGLLLVLLVAVQPALVHFSAQLKPYTLDAAATLLLVWLGLRAAQSDARGRVAGFWAAAAVAAWLSTPAIITGAAVGGVLAVAALYRRRWRTAGWHALGAIGFVASASAVYALHLRFQQGNGRLAAYWEQVFPTSLGPREPGLGAVPGWLADTTVGLVHLPLGVASSAPVLAVDGSVWVLALAALLGLGLVCLVPRGAAGAVVYAPVLAAFALAAAGLYPLADRAALWVAPLLLVLVCVPLDAAVRALGRHRTRPGRGRRAALVAVAGVVVLPLVAFAPPARRGPSEVVPERYALTRQALHHVASRRQPGDVVLVQTHTVPAALWYADQVGLEWTGSLVERRGAACATPMRRRYPGAARLWVVLGLGATGFPPYVARLRAEAAAEGTDRGARRFHGVWVIEVDLTAPASVRPRPSPCLAAGPKTYRNRL